MKKKVLSIIFLVSNIISFGQNKAKSFPFIIQGQLANYPAKELFLVTQNEMGYVIDTIAVNDNGKFYLMSYKRNKPQKANLTNPNIISTDLYIAPGFNLTLSGNGKDLNSFNRSKKIAGVGSESNKYLFIRDSILSTRVDSIEWFNMNEHDLLSFVKRDQHLNDSLYKLIFAGNLHENKWFKFFGRMTWFDNNFKSLNYLINHAIDDTNFSYEKTISFITSNSAKTIVSNLYKEKYLIYNEYRYLMNGYPLYLWELNCRRTPDYRNDKKFNVQIVEQVANNYRGEIRQLVLFRKMDDAITYCRSFEELNMYKTEFPKYISQIVSKAKKEKLESGLVNMEATLLKTQIGKPAPAISAEDSSGKKYQITDYLGKVVYLDLWASWCGPCRGETPYLKKIVEKYKNDSRIAFVSIAVIDEMKPWKEALIKDKPTWLQLFDRNGTVQSSYVANSIPKFILINKEGKIVSFDAPSPSSGEAIEKLLDEEIAK